MLSKVHSFSYQVGQIIITIIIIIIIIHVERPKSEDAEALCLLAGQSANSTGSQQEGIPPRWEFQRFRENMDHRLADCWNIHLLADLAEVISIPVR